MNPISKILHKAGDLLNFGKKFYDIPDIEGGFEIFRNFSWADSGPNKLKQLNAYRKSLYIYACVSKIAQKTASIDWQMYRIKNRAGDTQEVFDSPALDLLYHPNPWQTKAEFFEKYMINKKLAGETFVLKVRKNGPGSEVVELWNLRPDYVTIVKDPTLFIKAYEFNKSDGRVTFSPDDIIHDSYPNPLDDFGGLSALCAAETRIDTEWNATQYQKTFFQNNARPDFILSSDNKISADQKEEIKEAWDKRHKGSKNSGKGAVLEGGLKYQQVSISQREMDYIESLKMTRDDILTALGVPKPIVAITDDVNLANAETAMEIFLSETIEPEIKRLTEKLNEHLIYPDFGDIFYIDYDRSFIPKNNKDIAEVQDIQIKNGTLLINEARELQGRPPVVGGWSMYMPAMNVPVGGLPQSGNSGKTLGPDKRRVFRGRGKAIEFLKVRDMVEKEVYAGLEKNLRAKIKKESTRAFIVPEIRLAYYDQTNKAIDEKGEAFKPAILKFSEEQHGRLDKALGLSEKTFNAKSVEDYASILKTWAKNEEKLMSQISLPFIQEFLVSAGKDSLNMIAPAETFTVTEQIQKYIQQRANDLGSNSTSTTVDKISRTLAEGLEAGEGINELSARIGMIYSEFPDYRADMIARTEATAANNKGFIESYDQSGVANAKEWIATEDGRTRDSHQHTDGEIVGLNEDFSNGLSYPGDPGGDPSETVNCRCVLGPAFKE